MPKQMDLKKVRITGGYLGKKQAMNVNVAIPAVYSQFKRTGRIDSVDLKWRAGMPDKPHIFWDSDVAKWIEGVSFALAAERNAELENIIDSLADRIQQNQSSEGYYNIYYQTCEYSNRFTNRANHELYCAGHLIEAAIAYKNATGKDKFLKSMIKYADYIDRLFRNDDRPPHFKTPGHEEIELALVKLYQETGNAKYLELSRFFISARGKSEQERATFSSWASSCYAQDHLPVEQQFTAEGHAVRCLYLFAGAADIAREYGDEKLRAACESVYNNIVNKRMYVTGGVGGNYSGEAFSRDYDLPNELAYTETCASIAMMFFCQRMFLLTGEKKYIDTLELQFYNGVMSGISANGDTFFYCNPLEVHPERRDYFTSIKNGQFAPEYERPPYFGCSCCPPNVIRIISSIGQYMYHCDGNNVYVNLFGCSRAEFDGVTVIQETEYPNGNEVRFTLLTKKEGQTVLIRIPDWCRSYSHTAENATQNNGYLEVKPETGKYCFSLAFDMPAVEIHSNPKAYYSAGCVAVKRGPVIFCAEEIDNQPDLRSATLKKDAEYETGTLVIGNEEAVKLTCGAYFIKGDPDAPLYSDTEYQAEAGVLTLIPYALWANRGRGEMLVWLRKERQYNK